MVPSNFSRSKAGRCVPVLLAALVFAGCGTRTTDESATHLQGQAQANSGYYLQQMQQATNDTKTTWQLLAIRALLGEGKTQQAVTLFRQLPGQLTAEQQQEAALLNAELTQAQGDRPTAAAMLAKISPQNLSTAQQRRYWQAQVNVTEGKPTLDHLRALIALEPMLPAAEQQKNHDATWHTLARMTQQQAQALVINADENTLQGWLDLQHTWFINRNDPAMMKAAIKDWQTRYPQNPGAKLLPTQLASVQSFKPASTTQIALLLPLSGQAAVFGQTIEQGFMAARSGNLSPQPVSTADDTTDPQQHAQASNITQLTSNDDGVVSPSAASVSDLTGEQPDTAPQAAPVQRAVTPQVSVAGSETSQPAPAPVAPAPAPAGPVANVKVYDTNSQPLNQIIEQARLDGASLIVGPLLKNQVEQLIASNTPLNVLALNQPGKIENRPNICYFALSPEDEARNAADRIWQAGQRSPLILAPHGDLGNRVAEAFTREWVQLGGGTVRQQRFGSVAELRGAINSGAGIALSGTPVSLSGTSSPVYGATSGDDGAVDAAYIVATQPEVALLKPMIAMRTGSRSNAVLYASSRSSQRRTGADFRLEMEGLQYSEIPLLAGENPGLMQQVLSTTRHDYNRARLYAMGADAWTLANNFAQMRQVPGFHIRGNTGELSADANCVIDRKLTWLRYQSGQIISAM
ncbi:penicillin-binding protein activator [Shimwellia blattae]|uniref:Penicillin-binding protein activator LpoA n=1 Tax=Shimwellia blattae (strain ATCC 29907 / DSM 4481 / JCM 1650 / NBRC 105725 / CDC 9005-74) TaxID=630626 RepID=I2B4W2_SHIBC|nr:penicillin-binding protein activator [Shimwellia blattae]AFJ45566.1 LppC family lipoprotein [Shimwellia blattae DSM 4481 = NBRC 105725]GAB81494.1 penicillin-binding protein activator LpoA [Shimwellia blattae DSM 4481 = NBRC 105725]VDY63048.1 Lipoprotein activator of PBP from the outer membrane A [Shimwellia blattae]VEC20195.1 Lipoprotein activator of PBP from the outer membrane A [Shimwellia blattae]